MTDDEAICQICGATVAPDEAAYCVCCATPHHRDCWAFTDHCSTYACPGVQYVTDGEEAERRAEEAAERLAALARQLPTTTPHDSLPDDLSLPRPDGPPVPLKRPVVVVEVGNGVFVIDNKQGVIRHQSHEKEGLDAFSRIIPVKDLKDTTVIERANVGPISYLYDYIPVLRTVRGRLVPLTKPFPSRVGGSLTSVNRYLVPVTTPADCEEFVRACEAAQAAATALSLSFVPPGTSPTITNWDTALAHIERRMRPPSYPPNASHLGEWFLLLLCMLTLFLPLLGIVMGR